LGIVALGLVIYGLIFGYHYAQIQLGPFAPLAAALGLFVLLAVFGPFLLIHYYRAIRSRVIRFVSWLDTTIAATGLPRRLARRYPRFTGFFVERFMPGSPLGLVLSLWIILGAVAIEQVVELALEVTRGSLLPGIDLRIENLVAIMRTNTLDHVFYAVTWLGSAEVLGLLVLAVLLVSLVAKKYRSVCLLAGATVASWLSVDLVKHVIARPRPPIVDARILEPNFSFPSGHAAVSAVFYGVSTYLLVRALRRDSSRIAVAILAALLVLITGTSRMYLGVHFPSDVLAGWMLGIFWLSISAVVDHLWLAWKAPRVTVSEHALTSISLTARVAAGFVLLVCMSALVGFQVSVMPPRPVPKLTPPTVIAPTAVRATVQQKLPHYTEGLTGARQEPVSIVLVGTRTALEATFKAAGWTEAQSFSFDAVGSGIKAALAHRSAPDGPVTPSFLAAQPNVLAFSLPVGKTFAERHHIRIWSTNVETISGQALWLATASFDKGFELAPSTSLPTHQIDPAVDAERAFILRSLEQSGHLQDAQIFHLVPPESGVNFDGDPFHTDGRTLIMHLT